MRPALICVLVTTALLGGCGSAHHDASSQTQVHVSVSQCGSGWDGAGARVQRFELINTDTRAGEVMLTDAKTGAVYADVSDPTDEQHFLVSEINALQKSKDWSSTAVVIAYDDSDGWYNHVSAPIKNSSNTASDAAICTGSTAKVAGGYQDRCGPGPRLPLLAISPYARSNFISHTQTEQASITKFIEDNWFTPRIGDASFDARAGSLDNLFDFTQSNNKTVILKPNGSVKSIKPIKKGKKSKITHVVTKSS